MVELPAAGDHRAWSGHWHDDLMLSEPNVPSCRRCDRPVLVSRERFDVFEQMHYVCFHYEFEHDPTDVDEECSAGGCPSRAVNARPDRRPDADLGVGRLGVDDLPN